MLLKRSFLGWQDCLVGKAGAVFATGEYSKSTSTQRQRAHPKAGPVFTAWTAQAR